MERTGQLGALNFKQVATCGRQTMKHVSFVVLPPALSKLRVHCSDHYAELADPGGWLRTMGTRKALEFRIIVSPLHDARSSPLVMKAADAGIYTLLEFHQVALALRGMLQQQNCMHNFGKPSEKIFLKRPAKQYL
eukprot:5900744-Amphidinium_carterae.1